MITKFARLEFDLFTKPFISDFLRVPQPIAEKNSAGWAGCTGWRAILFITKPLTKIQLIILWEH